MITMTANELEKLPWACPNIPEGWDFRNKTSDDLAPLCCGLFVNTKDAAEHKIIYGGEVRAREALRELGKLGIPATVRDGGQWAQTWTVDFRMASIPQHQLQISCDASMLALEASTW